MKSLRFAVVSFALLFVLTACQVTVTGPGPGPVHDLTLDASGLVTDPAPVALDTLTIPANGDLWIRVRFGATSGADLRYVEIRPVGTSSGLKLEWWSSLTGSRQLVSLSENGFGPSEAALSAGGAAVLERSSISFPFTCLGPCIARGFASGSATIRVVNDASSPRTVDFFAYARQFADENEPNDSPAAATQETVFAKGEILEGAIETSGDVDYFSIDCSGTELEGVVGFKFDAIADFVGELELTVFGGAGEPDETIGSGMSTENLFACPALVRVRALAGVAGAPAVSRYFIEIR